MSIRKDEVQLVVEINGEKAGGSLRDLQIEARKWKRALDLATDPAKATEYANNLKKVNSAIAEIRAKTRGVVKEATGVTAFFKNLVPTASAAAAAIAAAFSFRAVIRGIGSLISTAANFQQAMSEVKSVTTLVGDDFTQLSNKARQLGSETSKTATEAAQGLKFLALAGFSVEEQLQAIEPALRLSEAGNIDLARASDLATDSMSAFGTKADGLNGFLDIIANTSTKSNTSIEQLTEGFIKSGGILNSLNTSTAEASALFGILANRGLKGAEGATALNAVLINMTTGAGEAGRAMKELNVNAFDNEGNFRGVSVVLKDVNDKIKGLSEEQQNLYKSMIGGKRQIAGFNALLAGVSDEFDELNNSIVDSDGKLKEVALTMQDNFNGTVTRLKSALEGLAIAIGTILIPVLTKLAEVAIFFISAIKEIPKFINENKVVIGALSVALITLNQQAIINAGSQLLMAARTKAATIATASQTIAQRGLNAVLKANPIGLIVTALSLVISAFDISYRKSETFRAAVQGVGAVAAEVFNVIKEAVSSFVEGWDQLKDGNIKEGLKLFGKGIVKSNPIGIAFTEGERLKSAFFKGFANSVKEQADNKAAEDLLKSVDNLDAKFNESGIKLGQNTGNKILEGIKSQLDGETINIQTSPTIKNRETIAQPQAIESLAPNQISDIPDNEIIQQRVDAKLEILKEAGGKELDELKIQFLQKLLTEQEYTELELASKASNLEQKLNLLIAAGLTETEAFRKTQVEQLEIQQDLDQKKLDNAQRTAEMQQQLLSGVRDDAIKTLDFGIQLLNKDEDSRKKHGTALKAFEVAKIQVGLPAEIQGIWKNAKITLPEPFATILAVAQTGLAIGRASSSISKISKQKFFKGGHTGNKAIYHDGLDGVAGIVHINEHVTPAWQLQDPESRPHVDFLESIRRKKGGYAAGGFTDVDTTPSNIQNLPLSTQTEGNDFSQLAEQMSKVLDALHGMPYKLKAYIVHSEYEAASAEIKSIESEANI